MLKILILTNNLGGLFSFRIELLDKLNSEGHTLIVCAPFDKYCVNQLEERGIKFIPTEVDRRGMNPKKDLKLFLQYRSIIRQENPDFVLTYTIKPNIYGGLAARLSGVQQLANVTGLGSTSSDKGLLNKLIINLYKLALRKAIVFFQNSSNLEYFKQNGIKVKKMILIPGSGVNLNKFKLQQYPEENPIKFIFVGRIMAAKGIEEYLKLAEHYKDKFGDKAEFHILGGCEENYKSRLESLNSSGVVVWHGYKTNIADYITEAHCLIHPSYYPEGMSNVILEASAIGRPIITTRRPGCMDSVEEGETGFLFDARNFDDLLQQTDKFFALSHQEKKKMGEKAHDKMEKSFNRDIVINAYLKELKA